jgi:hypothetical protein
MPLSPATPPAPRQRLYDEAGRVEATLLAPLRQPLHQLFAHWVQTRHHARDFIVAMDHAASVLYANYLLEGAPDCSGMAPFAPADVPVPATVATAPSGPVMRLYDDEGNLAPSQDTLQLQQRVLAPLFLNWAMQPRVVREFILAVHDVASALCYDYDICQSMGGLGGGKTAEQFLAEPFLPAPAHPV